MHKKKLISACGVVAIAVVVVGRRILLFTAQCKK